MQGSPGPADLSGAELARSEIYWKGDKGVLGVIDPDNHILGVSTRNAALVESLPSEIRLIVDPDLPVIAILAP